MHRDMVLECVPGLQGCKQNSTCLDARFLVSSLYPSALVDTIPWPSHLLLGTKALFLGYDVSQDFQMLYSQHLVLSFYRLSIRFFLPLYHFPVMNDHAISLMLELQRLFFSF